MTVYVDNMSDLPMGRYRGMKMSHMIADTTDELLQMADTIGLPRRHLQKAGTAHEHFDISLSYKQKAINAGAIQISIKELAKKTRAKRLG